MNINRQKIIAKAKESKINNNDINWILKKASVSNENPIDIIPVVKAFREQWTQKAIKQQKLSTDINAYKTYEALASVVQYTGRQFLMSPSGVDDSDIEKIGSVASWDIYLPKTENGSKGFDPGQKETTWCTTRKMGNLFGNYAFRDIILFYVKSTDKNDHSSMSRVSLGFNQGEILYGGSGGASVDVDNDGISESKLDDYFGPENKAKIIAICQKKSKELNHIHPFSKYIQDMCSHPRAFRKKMKPLTIDNVYATVLQVKESRFDFSKIVIQEVFEKGSWQTKMILFRFGYFPSREIKSVNPENTPLFVALALLKNREHVVKCYLDYWKSKKNPSRLKHLSDMAVITKMLGIDIQYKSQYQYAKLTVHLNIKKHIKNIEAYEAKRIKEFLYQIPLESITTNYTEEYYKVAGEMHFSSLISTHRSLEKPLNPETLYTDMFEDLYAANYEDAVLDSFVSYCTMNNLDTLRSIGYSTLDKTDLLLMMHSIYLFKTNQSNKLRFKEEFFERSEAFLSIDEETQSLPIYLAEMIIALNLDENWDSWDAAQINKTVYLRLNDTSKQKQAALFKNLLRYEKSYKYFSYAILNLGSKTEIKRSLDMMDDLPSVTSSDALSDALSDAGFLGLFENKNLKNNQLRYLLFLKGDSGFKKKMIIIEQNESVFTKMLKSNTLGFRDFIQNKKFTGLTLKYFGTKTLRWQKALDIILENKVPVDIQLQILEESSKDAIYFIIDHMTFIPYNQINVPHPKVLESLYKHEYFKTLFNRKLFDRFLVSALVYPHPILDDHLFDMKLISGSFIHLTKKAFQQWLSKNKLEFMDVMIQSGRKDTIIGDLLKRGLLNQKMVKYFFENSTNELRSVFKIYLYDEKSIIEELVSHGINARIFSLIENPETARAIAGILEKHSPRHLNLQKRLQFGTKKSIEERILPDDYQAGMMLGLPSLHLNKSLTIADRTDLIKRAILTHELVVTTSRLNDLNGHGIELDYSEL